MESISSILDVSGSTPITEAQWIALVILHPMDQPAPVPTPEPVEQIGLDIHAEEERRARPVVLLRNADGIMAPCQTVGQLEDYVANTIRVRSVALPRVGGVSGGAA
jgi:hypothetical protein